MNRIKKTFAINTLNQAEKVLKFFINKKIKPIIYIRNYIIKGFGYDWIVNFKQLLESKFNKNFYIYADAGYDFGLCTILINNKINYIKIKSNKNIMKKLQQIAKKNKVLLNPNFNIVDLSNLKNLEKKLEILTLDIKK
ncbi:MAG: hypothetical protein CMI96_02415 [Pelagibacteraceae bacterium]|nr:hypothetical protein [Pelagibacteraceae bacterium]